MLMLMNVGVGNVFSCIIDSFWQQVMECFCIYLIFSRCVSNQKPLLDSGTMGTKGHTEIIVPNLTESYNSHVSPCVTAFVFCLFFFALAFSLHYLSHTRSASETQTLVFTVLLSFPFLTRGTPQKRRSHSALSSLSLLS